MDRRQLLKSIAVALGSSLSPTLSRALIQGASVGEPSEASVLSADQRKIINALAEIIIPETDTPGALAAGAPNFVVNIVDHWYTNDEVTNFLRGLSVIDQYCISTWNTGFIHCDESQHRKALLWLEANDPFFFEIRELTVVGFFTSEVGAKKALSYNPAPMKYDGAYPIEKAPTQWSY